MNNLNSQFGETSNSKNIKHRKLSAKLNEKKSAKFVAFKANLGMNVDFMDFSQKRRIGFRSKFEFENKTILVANPG